MIPHLSLFPTAHRPLPTGYRRLATAHRPLVACLHCRSSDGVVAGLRREACSTSEAARSGATGRGA
jgi:hypothetical protein